MDTSGNYIRNQFCSYEIALKLKELGFDEECFSAYTEDGGLMDIGNYSNYDEIGELDGHSYYISCLSPIWQQVIDWLREKYNLCIEIQCPQREFDFYSWTIHEPLGINDEEYNCQTYEDGFTNNYYKAREQAILKVIELCKR